MADSPTFRIGLTMAGAVSAGAYTAGVIDFLLEALDAIEDVRAGRDTGYLKPDDPKSNPVFDPPHDVRIETMSGTSAGSMVTAIVATILGTRIKPVGPDRQWTDTGPTGNPLYDAWVQDIHYDRLLSTTDLDGGEYVTSLLNSDELGKIVRRTLEASKKNDYVRPYAAEAVPIYFCVSNLRGVRYSLGLNVDKGVANEYQMSMHADRMGFNWSTDGRARNGFVSVLPGGTPAEWSTLGNAALASGAFPLGLAPRELRRRFADYVNREWFIPGALLPPTRKLDANGNPVNPADDPGSWESHAGTYDAIPPLDHESDFPDGVYSFLNVDGGIFDNEPLELVRRELAGGRGRNPRDARIADRGVILIDPFPNVFGLSKDYSAKDESDLLSVVRSLFPAMIAQARFKLDELALARDPSVASRYAIMPTRYASDKPAKYAIACGSLGGFGGFLSKAFRHHDFMLGRRNCQKFLADHLALPADRRRGVENPLFARWPDDLRDTLRIAPSPNDPPGQPDCLPIVPLLGKLGNPDYTRMPPWPAAPADLKRAALKDAVTRRADALKNSLVAQYAPAWGLRIGINSFWYWKKSGWVDRFAIDRVTRDLDKHGIRLS